MGLRRILLAAATLAPVAALAAPKAWTPVISPPQVGCTDAEPCRVTEKAGPLFSLSFEIMLEKQGTLREIKRLAIRDAKTGTVQGIKITDAARAPLREPFLFYSVDLLERGERDLALLSFTSPREGQLFLYFLYDPATRKFRPAGGPAPALRYRPPSHDFVAVDDRDIIYRLDVGGTLRRASPPSR